jgi:hypothetical protein
MMWLRSEQAVLTAVFCLAEALWFLLGIRFDHADPVTTPLYNYVQYVDPALLRDRYFESLFYLHAQPPLFQAFVGVLLHFPESWHVAVFGAAYAAMALALVLCSRALLADLGVGRLTRLVACVYLIFSPPLVLLAKWFYVQMPVAALLVAAALLLHRAAGREKVRYFLGYGASVAAIALVTWCGCSRRWVWVRWLPLRSGRSGTRLDRRPPLGGGAASPWPAFRHCWCWAFS